MDEGADVTKVEWREWGAEAFEVAERRGAPVLLALTTPWSADCREMDETTYAEPRIAANINDGFVPVRVDADRHPRIRERYVMGGFPSTVFLTPAGEILSGATFLGPAGFRGILDSVRGSWDARGEAAGSLPRTLTEAAPPGGTLSDRVEEHMVEQLLAAYDDEFGGWGTDVKFPLPRTIEFALVRARDQATRTLEAVQTHLLDTYDGGFYRLAHNRNWRDARREKLVDENAAVLRAFAHGYRYTGEESYLDTATTTLEYLTTTAWTGEAFAASQAAADDYYTMEPTEREAADAPAVDDTVLADRNGLAVDALLALAAYTDDERARSFARRARDHVVETLVDDDGRVTHFAPDAAASDEPVPSGLLLDQARLLQGLTRSWSVLGEPGPAETVADWTIEHLQHESGAFRDGPTEGAGLLDRPLYPLDTTVECADALLSLSHLADEEAYAAAARDALSAFAGAADRMGVEVATYASAVARALDPEVVAVATPAGSDLHRAALRLVDHETTVVPAADGPDAGTAEVRADDAVRGTADSPASLEALLTDA